MHDKPMGDSEGTLRATWIYTGARCRHCGGRIRSRQWDSHCGGYTDEKHSCEDCGHTFWVDGPDA